MCRIIYSLEQKASLTHYGTFRFYSIFFQYFSSYFALVLIVNFGKVLKLLTNSFEKLFPGFWPRDFVGCKESNDLFWDIRKILMHWGLNRWILAIFLAKVWHKCHWRLGKKFALFLDLSLSYHDTYLGALLFYIYMASMVLWN